MNGYHDHYLKKDVLLLDFFEKFIDLCLKFHGLDPCHYFSSPGLSWHSILIMGGVELEKISDIRKYLFIEKELKGGVSHIAKRYAKANNKYIKDYDPKKPSRFITYLDMNNLYCWTMSECLLYERFKWLKNVKGFDVNAIGKKSKVGFILKVDLQYPKKLHASQNDYPLAPEKRAVSYEMLSHYCKKVAHKNGINVGDVKKLIPN